MIEQPAIVTECDDKVVWVQAERQSTCSGCKMKQGCGTGLLANHVGKRFSRIAINNTSEMQVGQHVQLTIPEQALLKGALLMYLLPIFLLFIFSAVTHLLNFNEMVEIIAGLGGLFIGFYLVRKKLENYTHDVQATIVKTTEEKE